MGEVRITRGLAIPEDELELRFSTSGGPGGQHANKASTRAELAWNVATSRALGPRQRARIFEALKNRIDSAGVLRLSSDRYRSQLRNREDVTARLIELLAAALKPRRRRIATAPTIASREKRLRAKRRRAEIKKTRRVLNDDG